MTDGEKLFLKCSVIFAALLAVCVTSCIGYRSYLISTSPDPMETACALRENLDACRHTGEIE